MRCASAEAWVAGSLLASYWREGEFQGASAEEAFFMRGKLGPAGPPGQPGTSFDPSKVTVVTGISADVPPGQIAGATVACPAGAVALGGGGTVSAGRLASSLPTVVSASDPSAPGGWSVIAVNDTTLTIEATADAICLSP